MMLCSFISSQVNFQKVRFSLVHGTKWKKKERKKHIQLTDRSSVSFSVSTRTAYRQRTPEVPTILFNGAPLCPAAGRPVWQKELMWTDRTASSAGSEPAESSPREGSRTENVSEDSAPHSPRRSTSTRRTPRSAIHPAGNLHKCHLLAKINNLHTPTPPPPPTNTTTSCTDPDA